MIRRCGQAVRLLLIAAAVAVIPGCYDRLDLEEASSALLVGYDLDDDRRVVMYVINPLFGKTSGDKTQEIKVEAHTFREARDNSDARSAGAFHGRKIQIVLVGRRILEHAGWLPMLDVFFRDARNPLTPRVIAFDGPMSELIRLHPPDQPMLPMLLRGMIDTKSARLETVKTTLQELHRQFYEKGMTPYVSNARLEDGDIVLEGMTLLDHDGRFAVSLNLQDTILMQMLQGKAKRPVSLTFPVPGHAVPGPFRTDRLSVNAHDVRTTIKCGYADRRFRFDIRMHMRVDLTERLFPSGTQEERRLERIIASQVQRQMDGLIGNVRLHRIDPIGLGLYARAYQYEAYKQAQEHWGDAVAAADIRLRVSVIIETTGVTK